MTNVEISGSVPRLTRREVATFARKVLRAVDVEPEELSIAFVDDESMRELNRKFRRKNKTTDVLTFPGDIAEKVNPYLRPLYDSLYDIIGFEKVEKMMERSVIEIAPLAFMRGRTLNDSFIILDEAQNTTPEQMKMFLTRLGFGSKCVVTGDVTQVDLPTGKKSGLREARNILHNVEGINFFDFTDRDVVRHPLVAKIVVAYDKVERELKEKEEAARQQKHQDASEPTEA